MIVNDQLVKVIRAGERQTEHQVRRSQDDNSDDISDDNDYQYLGEEFTMEVLSGVCFASLLRTPALETKIDAKVWNPESHCLFPQAFRKASLELLMCSNSKYIQPLPLIVSYLKKNNLNLEFLMLMLDCQLVSRT